MNANGTLLVLGHDPYGAIQWWSSDGSEVGTRRYPELGESTIAASSRDRVFAAGSNPLGTLILSDPVTHATESLATFDAVVLGGSVSFFSPSEIMPFRNGIVFDGYDSAHGVEPWVSEGTSSTTNPLDDIVAGPSFSTPTLFTRWDDGFVFAAEGPTPNRDLWRSDGTRVGTTLFLPAYAPTTLVPAADQLFMLSCRQDIYYDNCSLYGIDGQGGHRRHAFQDPTHSRPRTFGRMVSETPITGRNWGQRRTWADGGGDIWPGGRSSAPSRFTRVGDSIFFSASDDIHGRELWKTDGTTTGRPWSDIVPELGGPILKTSSSRTARCTSPRGRTARPRILV
jgi:ELWxxDGT repeat protein